MAKIYAPNKNYNGVSASIHFIDGVGETDDKYLIEWFKEHGYEVKAEGKLEEETPKGKLDEDEEETPKGSRRK